MTRRQAEALAKALKKRFGGKVEFEAANGHGKYRFAIVSKRCEAMTHLHRQDVAWEVVDETLDREATLGVSMILAYAPADLTAV